MAAIAPPQSSAPRVVAACLAGLGAALLGVKAVLTFGPDQYDTLEPLAGVFAALVAGMAFAGGVSVLRAAPALSRVLLVAALGGALVTDVLPAAPPRYLPLLPLAIAAGLMFVAPAAPAPEGPSVPVWAQVLGWLSLFLHAVVGLLYLVSGLVVPGYGVLLLWVLWAALLVVALRLLRNRPGWTPVVPVVAAGLWFAIIQLGEAFLGWQP